MFWKKKEAEPMIRVDYHKDIVADIEANHASEMAIAKASYEQAIGIERDTVARLVAANRALKVELKAAQTDAEKYRRSRANLKQFRKADHV